jgi:hypothetical protein
MLALVTVGTLLPDIIIKSSMSIASSLISSIIYLKNISKNDEELYNLIESYDIIEDISIIKNYIDEKKNIKSNTISLCIKNLSITLFELEKYIKSITEKIENHNKLWFHRFRSYNISEEKKQIPLLILQLQHRFDILIKVTMSL